MGLVWVRRKSGSLFRFVVFFLAGGDGHVAVGVFFGFVGGDVGGGGGVVEASFGLVVGYAGGSFVFFEGAEEVGFGV